MAAISWFQTKIGTYDKANWERIVEKHEIKVHRDLQKIELKTSNIRPDFIDVDLIRGSTFTKIKPAYHWTQVTKKGILRVILFPFYYKWWQQQTSLELWLFFFVLYFLQLISVTIYMTNQSDEFKHISLTEAIGPILIMILLGEVYIHVVSTNFTRPPSHEQKKCKRRRKKRRRNSNSNSNGNVETISVPNSTSNPTNAMNITSNNEGWSWVRQRKVTNNQTTQEVRGNEGISVAGEIFENKADEKVNGIIENEDPASSTSENESSSSSTSSISDAENSGNFEEENPFTSPASQVNNEKKTEFETRLYPTEETVVVSVWDGSVFKKARMTLLEISSAIVQKVENHVDRGEYVAVAVFAATFLCILPLIFRCYHYGILTKSPRLQLAQTLLGKLFGSTWRVRLVVLISMLSNFSFCFSFFFLLCVTERAYKMRYLYAKYFGALTSARRARRNCLPHFRLHKVRHIKAWLSLRSFLKKRGPQRSVDTIISTSFLLGLVLLVIMCIQFTQFTGTSPDNAFLSYYCNWVVSSWCIVLGIYLMRFLTLGSEINLKYQNNSVLLTEQINLYLQMEHSPHKKEELIIANNVLKLACKLLKELESPFKVSGLIMSPLLSNITRVVVLSLFSGVMSDLLGFRLKLWKIKAT